MISEIENAMMARLKDGLGRMVSSVGSYGGELEDVGAIARVLPACATTVSPLSDSDSTASAPPAPAALTL